MGHRVNLLPTLHAPTERRFATGKGSHVRRRCGGLCGRDERCAPTEWRGFSGVDHCRRYRTSVLRHDLVMLLARFKSTFTLVKYEDWYGASPYICRGCGGRPRLLGRIEGP